MNDKIGRYRAEIIRIAAGMGIGARTYATAGNLLRFVFPARCGSSLLLMRFYIQRVETLLIHPAGVPRYCCRQVVARLIELNACLDPEMHYGIGKSTGRLLFAAGYDLRKKNPEDDAGLDGFCCLLFKTAPERLDRLNEEMILAPADENSRIQNSPQIS